MSRDFQEHLTAKQAARRYALQVLFQLDARKIDGDMSKVDEVLESFWKHLKPDTTVDPDALENAERMVRKTVAHRDPLDEVIQAKIQNWRLDRIGRVDRCILRLAAYEMLVEKVQTRIAITQAVELAKAFGTEESAGFVNGVLDRVALLRKEWKP